MILILTNVIQIMILNNIKDFNRVDWIPYNT